MKRLLSLTGFGLIFTVKATWAEIVALYRLTMDAPPHNLQPRYNAHADEISLAVALSHHINRVGARAQQSVRHIGVLMPIAEDDPVPTMT